MTFIHTTSRFMSPRRTAVLLLPILGLSIISCGGDSGLSYKASEEEFCELLMVIEFDQVFESAMDDPAAKAEGIELLTDLAKAAPTAELKEASETLISVWESISAIDENDPEALASLVELLGRDPKIQIAGETIAAFSEDVCKIPTPDSSDTSTEESLAP